MRKVKSLFKIIFNKKVHFEKVAPEATDYPILLITYDHRLKREHIFEANDITTKYILEENIKKQNEVRKFSKDKQTIEITGWLHKLY